MKKLKELYASGMVGKENFADVDATESPQRESAAEV